MLKLAWQFKTAAVVLIVMQATLVAMALSGLGLTGLGIDVIRHHVQPDSTSPPHWPFGLAPPSDWPVLSMVAVLSGVVFVIATLRFGLDRAATIWKAKLVQSIIVHLRAQVYDKMQRLSFRFFDANESGSIINRVTTDVQSVRLFVDGVLVEGCMMALSLTFCLALMFKIHPWLTFWCLLTTPLLCMLTIVFSRIVRPAYQRSRQLFDTAVLVLSENVQGVHVVKGFGRQADQIRRFSQANYAYSQQQKWIFWRLAMFVPVINFLPQINIIVLLIYGGWLMIQGEISFGTGLVVFAGVLEQFSMQVGSIANITNSVQRSITGAQRVFEILDEPLEICSPPHAVAMPHARGRVRFESVSFEYNQQESPILSDINFEAEPGSTVALLGTTGAGKTTLLSLIPRFYDPQKGSILIDDQDVRNYNLDDLRHNIGVVFQESFLFSHTVAQNIAFGHPAASREQIESAAKIAAAHEFICKLPNGYDTPLSESGGNLSGGQRQRLAIARAILLEPPILLLDDPTASIDPETEEEILQAMTQAMDGRTTLIVAHRLSTLRRAKQVIVLESGRIVQHGTHDQLLQSQGHYQRAASLQIADDESKRLLGILRPVTKGSP